MALRRCSAPSALPADYFDNPRDNAPSRSEIIVAENESDALHEAFDDPRDKTASKHGVSKTSKALDLIAKLPATPALRRNRSNSRSIS